MRRESMALMVVVGLVCLSASGSAGAQSLTLEGLLQVAMERNPTLVQVQSRIDAARADEAQSSLWPNLHVSYATETVNGHESHGAFFRQTVPTSGRIGASKAVHARDAEVGEILLEEQRLRVRNSVRVLYRDALIAVPQIALQEEMVAHLEETLTTIEQLVNVGLEDLTDVLETEMELHHARLDLNEERLEQRHVWTELAQMVGDPTLTLSPLAGEPLALPPPLDYDTMLGRLLSESPELQAAEALVERATAAVQFEGRETRPDIGVTVGRRYNRGLVGFGHDSPVPPAWEMFYDFDLLVPIWNRSQHAVRAAEADVRQERADADRLALELRSKFEDLFHEYEVERAEAQVFRDEILPRAEEVYALALARYEDFGEEYEEVLEARGAILKTRGTILESLADAWRKTVLIEGLLLDKGLAPPDLHLLENSSIGSADTEYK